MRQSQALETAAANKADEPRILPVIDGTKIWDNKRGVRSMTPRFIYDERSGLTRRGLGPSSVKLFLRF
jgi:hypothetical protein